MRAGDPTATAVRIPETTNYLMPANVEGTTAPDPPGWTLLHLQGRHLPRRLRPAAGLPADPRLRRPREQCTFASVATGSRSARSRTPVCGFFNLDCIPQPGTNQGLDALSEWPMQHLAYRRFADHEALVGNFTVPVGGGRAGIRWFELRNTGSGYSLFQEGTRGAGRRAQPLDGLDRDQQRGRHRTRLLGLQRWGACSRASATSPGLPRIRPGRSGRSRRWVAGGGSQTSAANRWGDYTAMAVDPSNNCDFWYTNEYYSATAATAWKTAIGRFAGPAC